MLSIDFVHLQLQGPVYKGCNGHVWGKHKLSISPSTPLENIDIIWVCEIFLRLVNSLIISDFPKSKGKPRRKNTFSIFKNVILF